MSKVISKLGVFACAFTIGLSGAVAAAQEQYRRCPDPAMEKGRQVVADACGKLSAPALETTRATAWSPSELDRATSVRDRFNKDADSYAKCVFSFIQNSMRPGSTVDEETLDYAACAHQWAEEQRWAVREQVGLACIAWEDANLKAAGKPCFPS